MNSPAFEPGTQFYLPELARHIPVRCHPQVDDIIAKSNKWVRSHFGFAIPDRAAMDAFCADGYALWTSLLFPTLADDRTVDIADWTQYFFLFDNVCSGAGHLARRADGARELFSAITAVMEGRKIPTDYIYVAPFEELWSRIAVRMPPRQRDRFAASVACFVDGCFSEVRSRAEGRVLDYETYMATRRNSAGGKMYFVLVEYGLNVDLTDDLPGPLPGAGALGELIGTTLDYLILTNDLFSFREECAKNDYVNSVPALIVQDGLDLQGAIDKVCEVADDYERKFLAQRTAILESPLGCRSDVQAYVDGLGWMMSGNLHWSYLTPRYHGAGHVWNGATSGRVTLHPDRTVFEPAHR
ncbi:MAG: terpene synthase family protein [Pseudonocardiaceae bacterium]